MLMRSSRRLLLLLLALGVALCFGAEALARPLPTGPPPTAADLAARGCVDDNDSGPEACAASTNGLHHVSAVVVSPDGNSVYATSFGDNAVSSFRRNPATGRLTPLGCIDDIDIGPDACAASTIGLAGASGIAVSPDGSSVYVASEFDNSIVRFGRDPATGGLTPQGCISDPDPTGDTPAAACAQAADGLDNPRGVAVSSDGLSVFVSSFNDSALVRFDRAPSTGALTPIGCIDDTTTGPDSCGQSTIGLSGASGSSAVALDPRGESIYVASTNDDAIAEFTRNPATKVIAPLGCIDDNDTGPDACDQSTDGLDHTSAVTVSPDGTSVYATSEVDGAIVRFSRDLGTGVLTPLGCIDDSRPAFAPDACAQSAAGVRNSYSIVVTPDSRSVFTVARAGTLVGFERNGSSGVLTPATCVADNEQGPPGRGACGGRAQALDNAFAVAVSPDGNSAYVASQGDDAIQIFGLDPPDTALLAGPKSRTDHRTARFRFGSDQAAAAFACKLDKRDFKRCVSPVKVRVKPGRHTFQVVASDAAGNADSTPVAFNWRVTKRRR